MADRDSHPLVRQDFHGEASGRGRVYQQNRGPQFNVEQAYFGAKDLVLPWLIDVRNLPKAHELDPLELGVHRAPIERGSAVPPYVPRDIDVELDKHLDRAARQGGFVLLIGDSTAGKSRTAYEGLLRTLPDSRVFIPDDGSELSASVIGLVSALERCVIWLDDVERYLGSNGLTSGILGQLRAARVVLLGTVRTEQYRKVTSLEGEGESEDRNHRHQLTAIEHVFNQVEPLVLQRRWSPSEIERTKQVDDSRLEDAVNHSETYGIAEYLAAGPTLLREWRLAWEVGANPRGAALVSAAVDCARAGLTNALPSTLLEKAHTYYLDVAGGALLRPETIESAFNWATRRRYGVTSLLLPGSAPSTYRPFDYLPDAVIREASAPPVPDEIWGIVVEHAEAEPGELFDVALGAVSQARFEIAENAWTTLARAGDSSAIINLSRLLVKLDRTDEAESWCRQAAEAGDSEAATELGILLETQSNNDEAERWYRKAADQDDTHGAYHFAALLHKLGRVEEAETIYREIVERPGSSAAAGLGHLLAQSGQLEEAETWFRTAIDRGSRSALLGLGALLAEAGREPEAETWWLKAAEAGEEYAMANLGLMLSKHGRTEEAEAWYRKAIESGAEGARLQLGALLEETSRSKEAETIFREAANSSIDQSAWAFASFLLRSGRPKEAEPWLRKAIDDGESNAAIALADLLEDDGRLDEAETWFRKAAEDGNTYGMERLGLVYLNRGEVDEARKQFESGAKTGDPQALCTLGMFWDRQGQPDEAEKLFRTASEEGHMHAACLLGGLLTKEHRFEEAEQSYKAAFDGGHKHAAEMLALLMAQQGRGREAAKWRRYTPQSSYRKGSKGGKPAQKRRNKKHRRRR